MKQTRAVVIGAGPAGLAAALRAAEEGFDHVLVLEKRVHSEDNNHDSNLVNPTPPRNDVETFRDVFERNNVLQLSYWGLKQLETWGIHRDDPHLCLHRVEAVHLSDSYCPPNGKQYGEVREKPATTDIRSIHVPEVIQAHTKDVDDIRSLTPLRVREDNLPYEVSGVPIQCLQRALYHAAKRLHPGTIDFQYGVKQLQVVKREDGDAYGIIYVPVDSGRETHLDPDMIVMAEGARRELLIRDVGLDPVAVSKPQTFMYGFLKPDASSKLGPHIFFNRVWDEKLLRSDNNCFAKITMIGRPDAPGQAVVFVQCDGNDRKTLFKDMEATLHRAFPMLRDVSLELDTTIPARRFVVQETHLPRYVLDNLVAVGDAARTGHFCSASGVTHSLVSDGNAVGPLYRAIVQHAKGMGSTAAVDDAKSFCEARMREITRIYHENDLFWFYETIDPTFVRPK